MAEMMNLSINKEMLTPVIEEQVKAMMATILGGKDEIVDKLINQILTTKVDRNGKPTSYSDGKPYFEWILKDEITKVLKELITEEVKSRASSLKKIIKKQIQTEVGANKIADALLNGLNDTVNDTWRSTFNIVLSQANHDD